MAVLHACASENAARTPQLPRTRVPGALLHLDEHAMRHLRTGARSAAPRGWQCVSTHRQASARAPYCCARSTGRRVRVHVDDAHLERRQRRLLREVGNAAAGRGHHDVPGLAAQAAEALGDARVVRDAAEGEASPRQPHDVKPGGAGSCCERLQMLLQQAAPGAAAAAAPPPLQLRRRRTRARPHLGVPLFSTSCASCSSNGLPSSDGPTSWPKGSNSFGVMGTACSVRASAVPPCAWLPELISTVNGVQEAQARQWRSLRAGRRAALLLRRRRACASCVTCC